MPKYSNLYDIAFEVISYTDDGSDIRGNAVRKAIQKKLDSLSDDEIMEHIGFCDCYEIEEACDDSQGTE